MTALSRMSGALASAGHSLIVNGTTRVGIVTSPAEDWLIRWFDATTLAGFSRPVRQAILPASDASAAGHSVTYGGEVFVVRKVIPVTWQGTTLARRVFFS